ncbi:hypothetical protein AC579_7715 [Pseudocercospora musae]|uniref:Uncharacterized protein n=1 Tax=Pseudocercospora musae TaxID=113226 RepID=A0A139ITV5_9PEZI|nr:hypothetical protein AC579_7715 [Pseudocercospora musae]
MSRDSKYISLQTLAENFINAYNACSVATPRNLKPINQVFELRTRDCEQWTLPESLGIPSMTSSEYREFLEGIVRMGWEGMKMTSEKMMIDVEGMKMVIHAKTKGMTPVGEYLQEYVFMLEVQEEEESGGLKVKKVEEFVDSKFDAEFRGKLGKYMSEKQKS